MAFTRTDAFWAFLIIVTVSGAGGAYMNEKLTKPKVLIERQEISAVTVRASPEPKKVIFNEIVPFEGGSTGFAAEFSKRVKTLPVPESYISAAAVEPRSTQIVDENSTESDASADDTDDERKDPLVKSLEPCDGDLECIAVAIRERDKKRDQLLQQQAALQFADTVMKEIQKVALDPKTRVMGADSVEIKSLIQLGRTRTAQLREILQKLQMQTSISLADEIEE